MRVSHHNYIVDTAENREQWVCGACPLTDTIEVHPGRSGDDSRFARQLYRLNSLRQDHVVRSEIGIDFWLTENCRCLVGACGLAVGLDVTQLLLRAGDVCGMRSSCQCGV